MNKIRVLEIVLIGFFLAMFLLGVALYLQNLKITTLLEKENEKTQMPFHQDEFPLPDPKEPAPPSDRAPEHVICAMDMKKCKDGFFVSRVGPDCEFSPCPEEKASK